MALVHRRHALAQRRPLPLADGANLETLSVGRDFERRLGRDVEDFQDGLIDDDAVAGVRGSYCPRTVKAERALANLERRKLYPDLVLIGQLSYAYAPTIDSPQNAFANNPYNGFGGGIAAAVRMPLDLGPKLARGDRTRAEAEEIEARREEALGGVGYEVSKAFLELSEAETRLDEVHKGEKAGKAWVAAVSQNFELGLADSRDFSDALLQSFKMRTFALQAVYDLNVSAATLSRATGTAVP